MLFKYVGTIQINISICILFFTLFKCVLNRFHVRIKRRKEDDSKYGIFSLNIILLNNCKAINI